MAGSEPARHCLPRTDLDLECPALHADQRPRAAPRSCLDHARFAAASGSSARRSSTPVPAALERAVVVEHPERRDRHHTRHRLAVDDDVDRSERGCLAAARSAWATVAAAAGSCSGATRSLHHFVRAAGPPPSKISFAFCSAANTPTAPCRAVPSGSEMRRRRVFEVRHVHRRRAVQRVERHIERMPRPGELEAGFLDGCASAGNRHLVVEPPAPPAVAAERRCRSALDDSVERPARSGHGIVERLVPCRPRAFTRAGAGDFRIVRRAVSASGDPRPQFPGERGDGLFDVNRSAD